MLLVRSRPCSAFSVLPLDPVPGAVFVIAVVLMVSVNAAAAAVQPLAIDLPARPGERVPFSVFLTSSGVQESVTLQLYVPRQRPDGVLGYVAKEERIAGLPGPFIGGDSDLFEPLGWVSLEQRHVVLRPDETVEVKGHVQVPFTAAGSYFVVIMVEPEAEPGSGVRVRVRYAVRLHIRVDRPGMRPEARLLDFDLAADENNEPVIAARVGNDSRLLFDVSAEATIRDASRRVVERATLQSRGSRSALGVTPLYPGADVLFTAPVEEPLYPGVYELRLVLQYGDGLHITKTKQVVLTGDEFDQTERLRPVEFEPGRVAVELRPGGAAAIPLQVRNRTDEVLEATLGAEDVVEDYAFSVFRLLEVQTRGDTEFVLGGRQRGRTVLILRAPRDIAPGGYYGYLTADVFDAGRTVDAVVIPLEVVIPGEWAVRGETEEVAYDEFDDYVVFTARVYNAGTGPLEPVGVLYLHDEDGVAQQSVLLELDDDIPSVLPARPGYLVGTAPALPPGLYTGRFHLQFDGVDLDVTEFPVELGVAGGESE